MSEKSDPSFQKARDEALRALVQRGNLTPDQVSALRLNQVHLTTGTLVIEPDEFSSSAAASQPSIRLKLDSAMQRALIAWLVVRPDGPNDYLFPGAGAVGLDVKSINQVVAAEKPADVSRPKEPAAGAAPPHVESTKKPEVPSQPVTPRPGVPEKAEEPVPPPPPVATPRDEPEAVPLDEIESLRQRLAETYDAWAPAVTAAAVRRAADIPPSPPAEAEPAPGQVDSGIPPEPAVPTPPTPRPEEISVAPVEPKPAPGMPPPGPQETWVAEPMPEEPFEETPVVASSPPTSRGAGPELKGWQKLSQRKVTVKLSYRNATIGGLALLLVICCVGVAVVGGSMLGPEGAAGLLAGGSATETQTPTLTAPPATSTTPPSPTATVTMTTPTSVPSPTPTPSPVPTSTQGPTPTPVVIVVTATPTPEPSPTDTRVPTNTPEGGAPPEPTPTETPGFKYSAPVLIWPENVSVVPGVINILRWEPVGTLDDDEWYAVRLIYRQQGELVYAGDRVKIPEWRVPDRLYYASDGPELKYSWYVFVERDNPDGSATQLSPESETFEFRWE